MERRKFLHLSAAGASAALLAGCAGGEDDDNTSNGNGGSTDNGNGNGQNDGGNGGDDIDSDEALEDDDVESTREGLEILEHEFYEEDFSAGVEGVVANNTGEDLDYVEVGVVFYNEDGQRLDDSFTNTTDMPDGEEWLFDVPLLGGDAEDVDDYSIAVTDSPF